MRIKSPQEEKTSTKVKSNFNFRGKIGEFKIFSFLRKIFSLIISWLKVLVGKAKLFLEKQKDIFPQNLKDQSYKKKVVASVLGLAFLLLGGIYFFNNSFQEKISEVTEAEADLLEEEIGEDEEEAGEYQTNLRLVINTEKLKIDTPVFNDEDNRIDYYLTLGAAKHKTTMFPNRKSGNTVISGHSSGQNEQAEQENPNYVLFRDLDRLEKGDQVKLFYNEEEFIYQVFEQKVVTGDDVSILKQTAEREELQIGDEVLLTIPEEGQLTFIVAYNPLTYKHVECRLKLKS